MFYRKKKNCGTLTYRRSASQRYNKTSSSPRTQSIWGFKNRIGHSFTTHVIVGVLLELSVLSLLAADEGGDDVLEFELCPADGEVFLSSTVTSVVITRLAGFLVETL